MEIYRFVTSIVGINTITNKSITALFALVFVLGILSWRS